MSIPFKELPESALDALIADERKRVVAPLTEWRSLAAQLREEGILQASSSSAFDSSSARSDAADRSFGHRDMPQRRFSPLRWGIQAFASIVLIGGGILIGRGVTWTAAEEVSPAPTTAMQAATPTENTASAELVSQQFQTPDQALKVIKQAQMDYVMAAAYLASHEQSGEPVMSLARLRDRLAALDVVVTAAQNAVKETPNDPVLTQYYMSSSGARTATLKLLNQNLPNGAQLAGY